MKAMVLAAGLGTRLKPITNTKPKALVEVHGVPLLEIVLKHLIATGVTEVVINLHHFPQQIRSFVELKNNFGIRIEFSIEEKLLLNTGGGLKNAAWFFSDGEPFLLHNVDIVSDIDLGQMVRKHREHTALATLAVKQRATSRNLVFDENDLLCGWKSLKDGQEIKARPPIGETRDIPFCGVHVISPAIFDKLTETGVFSIIDSYLRLASEGEKILAHVVNEFNWQDVGKLAELDRQSQKTMPENQNPKPKVDL